MHVRNRLWLAAAAFAPLVLVGAPAHAGNTGTVTVTGFVRETFPCDGCHSGFGSLVAGGPTLSTGAATAVITGAQTDYVYSAICTAAGGVIESAADGVMTLTGVNVTGDLLPLTVPFHWDRVGNVAVITSDPGAGSVVVGAATFVPTSGPPTCASVSQRVTVKALDQMVAMSVTLCVVSSEGAVCVYV